MTERPPIALVHSALELAAWVGRLEADSWRRRPIDLIPEQPWDLLDDRWCCVLEALDDQVVPRIISAFARGVAVGTIVEPGETIAARLVDDLLRLGATEQVAAPRDPPRIEEARQVQGIAVLDEETRVLLALLSDGSSVTEAAACAHVSLRTAERRIASARKLLGVRTTAEALAMLFGPDT